MLVKLNLYYLTIQIIGAIYEDMNGSPLDEKLSFKILGLFFSSKLDCRSYNVSITKAANKNAESLSDSMNFVSSEVALYLCKSDIQSCKEYIVTSELVLLIVTWICWISSVMSQWDFWSYTFWFSWTKGSLLKLNQPKSFSCLTLEDFYVILSHFLALTRFTHYSNSLHDVSVIIPVMILILKVFFLTAWTLRNPLPAYWPPLTYDLEGLESRNNKCHFLIKKTM